MSELLGFGEILHYGLYLRGICITIFAIILFRASSSRMYGNHSPLDFIIYIIVGAIFGEAIVNNIPLLPSMIVTILIVGIYRIFSYLSFKSHRVGRFIKGDKITLIKKGKHLEKNLRSCHITKNDILQALRVQHSLTDLKSVKEVTLERSGQISFILD